MPRKAEPGRAQTATADPWQSRYVVICRGALSTATDRALPRQHAPRPPECRRSGPMPPIRRTGSIDAYGRTWQSRPQGYVCPYRRCGQRYRRHNHYQRHIDTVHAGQAAPAPQYRAPSPVDDPPDPSSTSEGSDDEDGSPSMPFWDWGPSRRHAKSIRLLSNEDLRSLGAGETLVAQVQQVMKHIERVSKPILEAITADSAPVWPPLQRHTEQWAHLQQGTQQKIWFKNSNSMCLRKQTILKQKWSANCPKKAQIKQISV